MRVMALSLISGGVVLVLAVAAMWWRHRSQRDPAPPAIEPHSLVRMLGNDDELRRAVERAVSFEQAVAASLHARASRYEAMLPTARVTDIRADRLPEPHGSGDAHGARYSA
ncbi:MAG: hypothetical protein M0Z63_14890 [Actinomycetota bacterium]|jgi:hypothetical protein|nr:hypothetical protein [Actinomycetota bacterium]MDA8281678.1 hypothetical protein [Actinomycetota bacterium]